jgi:hypothetical protein
MKISYEVQVHKANVPLQSGESLRKFTQELKKQASPILLQKFNSDEKKGGSWPLEVFANKAVFMLALKWDDVKKDQTVAFDFTRDVNTGVFKIGDVVKVKAVTQYEVQKRAELPRHKGMENWTPVETETKKSLWAGVL